VSDDKREELKKAVSEALAKLEKRSQVVVSPGGRGVAVMGHLRGKPRTIGNFCTVLISVYDTSPAELRKWVEELERELLEAN
jgi:hypothetical protein